MQKDLPSIEETLRSAWLKVFGYPVRAFAASRTDAQVHAYDQWAKIMSKDVLEFTQHDLEKLNLQLPQDIKVLNFKKIPLAFDVMSMAASKEYCYLFANVLPTTLPLAKEKIWHFEDKLDFEAMQKAADMFKGLHNFKNFQRRESSRANFVREIFDSKLEIITEWDGYKLDVPVYCYRVKAKGFLRQMVRIMVGALLNVGQGRVTLEQFKISLNGIDQTKVGFIPPGFGLYLYKINY